MVKKETKEVAKKATTKTKTKVEKSVVEKVKKEIKSTPKAEEKLAPKVAKEASVKKSSLKKSVGDTGSVDFQVKNFTDKIQLLSDHLKKHPHDFDSRRGLLIMVGKRRRLLNYYKKKDVAMYEKLAASLKLKK